MSGTDSEILRRIDEIGRTADRRISTVEREQDSHEREVEARLLRYEHSQVAQTDRIIEAVSSLAKLEAVPEQIRELRREFKDELSRVEHSVETLGKQITSRVDTIEARVTLSEKFLSSGAAKAEGRKEAWERGGAVATWVLAHGWQLVVLGTALFWGGQQIGFIPQRPIPIDPYTLGQASVAVTNRQPDLSEGARDWPLRTE